MTKNIQAMINEGKYSELILEDAIRSFVSMDMGDHPSCEALEAELTIVQCRVFEMQRRSQGHARSH